MECSSKHKPGRSCGCRWCRTFVTSKLRGQKKRETNRKIRHDAKAALHHEREVPVSYSPRHTYSY